MECRSFSFQPRARASAVHKIHKFKLFTIRCGIDSPLNFCVCAVADIDSFSYLNYFCHLFFYYFRFRLYKFTIARTHRLLSCHVIAIYSTFVWLDKAASRAEAKASAQSMPSLNVCVISSWRRRSKTSEKAKIKDKSRGKMILGKNKMDFVRSIFSSHIPLHFILHIYSSSTINHNNKIMERIEDVNRRALMLSSSRSTVVYNFIFGSLSFYLPRSSV